MTGNLVIVPFVVYFLSSAELGLWYTLVAISNLTLLFEFGFASTFARNFVYALQGATTIVSFGRPEVGAESDPNWELFMLLMRASKRLYGAIAIVVTAFAAVFGTTYLRWVSDEVENWNYEAAWLVMLIGIGINLYYFYTTTLLRGIGDIAGENRARSASRLVQLIATVLLLCLGLGILGAALGFFSGGLTLRLVALRSFRSSEAYARVRDFSGLATRTGVCEVLRSIAAIAWKDGIVQFGNFGATQCSVLLVSSLLGLKASGTYSVAIQLGTAIYNLSSAYVRSFYPTFQAAFAADDLMTQRRIVSRGVSIYVILSSLGILSVAAVIPPLFHLLKPELGLSWGLIALASGYLVVWNLHSIYCNFIVSTNEIPYWVADIVSAAIGLFLIYVANGWLELGLVGTVGAPLVVQCAYNVWAWPRRVHRRIGVDFWGSVGGGVGYWRQRLGVVGVRVLRATVRR